MTIYRNLRSGVEAIVAGDDSSAHRNSKLCRVATGDDSSVHRNSKLCRVATGEDGLMSWATLVAVVCFVTLIAIVFNVGRITNDKLEAQNAADSAAYSASLVQARAMNAVTTTNHMMGELTALYVMHHSIGGYLLDKGKRNYSALVVALNIAIPIEFIAANVAAVPALVGGGSFPENYSPCGDFPRGEATVYDSKCVLKLHLLAAIAQHISGSATIVKGLAAAASILGAAAAPGLIAAGIAKQRAANLMIKKIKQEYRFINSLETFALNTRSIKKNVIPGLLKAMWIYEGVVVNGSRLASAKAAEFIANKNMCVGEVLGRPNAANIAMAQAGIPSVSLPVVKEVTKSSNKSQLLRATYPWVREWRSKLLIGFDLVATLSRASRFYEYYSDVYAREISDTFRNKNGYKLYVLEGMDPHKKDKGQESWTTLAGSSEADQMFCAVGLARQKREPSMSHMNVLPRTNPVPIMAMAQGMFYSANPQGNPKPKKKSFWDMIENHFKGNRKPQPTAGWDTLNWIDGATEWKNGKVYMKPFGSFRCFAGMMVFMDLAYPPDYAPDTPKIKLNWQAKLVPIADKNLMTRILLVQDKENKKRMQEQVFPALVRSHYLGGEMIHH